MFAAGVSGGIWKSDDNATTWRPTGDGLTNIAVNSLLIDPARPDVMYAGTGEGYFREEIRGTGLPLRGSGIYVTTDGARSWQQLPATNTPDFHWVNDLEFGVNDSRRIYAATRSGVWRSTRQRRHVGAAARGQRARRLPRSRAAARSSEDVLFASCGSYEQATVYRFLTAADRSDVSKWCCASPTWAARRWRLRRRIPTSCMRWRRATSQVRKASTARDCSPCIAAIAAAPPGSWETRVNNHDPTLPQHDAADQRLAVRDASAATAVGSPNADRRRWGGTTT